MRFLHLQPAKGEAKNEAPAQHQGSEAPAEPEASTEAPAPAEEAPAPAPAPASAADASEIGASSGLPKRNPMSLLKTAAPLLSMEAYEAAILPLDDLRDAAGRAENCVWNRVCPALPSYNAPSWVSNPIKEVNTDAKLCC